RNTPVIIFINKLDREGRDPFDLLDELEEKLKINVRPLSWPISMGQTFQGVYNLYNQSLYLFRPNKTAVEKDVMKVQSIHDPILPEMIGKHAEKLQEDVELVEGVYEPFKRQDYLDGKLAPVFFG